MNAQALREIFGLDLRSLALLRILLGLLLLWDLADRLPDLRTFYCDDGLYPRSLLENRIPISIHLLSGSLVYQSFLVLVAAVLAVCLLVGWQTRLMTFLSWFLFISANARNPDILHGGDAILRMTLFWSLFLPLGARWSFDAAKRQRPTSNLYCSTATVAFLVQLCSIYWFAAAYKTDPAWRTEGTAIYYVLNIEEFTTRFGRWLLGFPDLLRFLTHASLQLERFGPLLLLVPFWRGPMRLVVIVLFVLFHTGLGLSMELGNFPAACCAAWLALLPGFVWTWLERIWPALTRSDKPLSPDLPPALEKTSLLTHLLVVFLTGYVLIWNLRDLDKTRSPEQQTLNEIFPDSLRALGYALGFEQSWSIFTVQPEGRRAGWYVVAGRLADGTVVDLLHDGQPISPSPALVPKPELVSITFQNPRWRKYLENLAATSYPFGPRYLLGDFLRREWNAAHPTEKQVVSFVIYHFRQDTLPHGKGPIFVIEHWPNERQIASVGQR